MNSKNTKNFSAEVSLSVFNNTNSLTGGPYVMGVDFGTEYCRV